ncbi:acetylornithine deacetylase [Actibacterium lipolyticum]|uniref:Acetylornithine deacetylase n=1 Tax=Actibacterium lipolyticum TaxID=1524263 RepID=A0A238JTN7_9RHOB|nr:acetylornithine deacetylase [Actibacterium lipolyticum]SMX34019.1 Acetylornithine deacetylase [Actibacterium lipolyticum]
MGSQLTPRQLLEKLVSFRTVSRDSNLDLVDWVEAYLAGFGISCTRVVNDTDAGKASLYTHVGPLIEGGVVLSGHTDVVPVDGQDWKTDPWQVTEADGKLFGRGTCDMKGFDALAIWALVRAHVEGVNRPLQIALSHDEEFGCIGAPPMIDHMVANTGLPRASTVLVGEPSEMGVVTGHKGGQGYGVHFKGYEVHSSIMHRGVSAIMEGAKLIDWANRQNAESRARTPRAQDAIFDPPFTTIHVGTISGGTAHNITAGDCRFSVDFRFVPGDDANQWRAAFFEEVRVIEAGMKAIHPDAHIDVKERFGLPALSPEDDGSAEQLARRLTGDNATHVVSYGTEAGQFQERGYSAVVCGPGNIEQAHQPNEFITIAQFEQGTQFMDRLLDELKE